MALKRISESPTIADDILFDINAPDAEGCYLADPYKVDNVVIYYVGRSFSNTNFGEITETVENSTIRAELEAAKAAACLVPSETNLLAVAQLQNQLELSTQRSIVYYQDAVAAARFGTDDMPAWLSTAPNPDDNALIPATDEHGATLTGKFTLTWHPLGMKEGDYIITWTWTPNALAPTEKLNAQTTFYLAGSTQLTQSLPTHYTNPDKYYTLQERYLPEMFKMTMLDADLSPQVLQELNKSVADGFTVVENIGNQLLDLADANATAESLLSLLGNNFNLKLRSTDPTLWRRQIKNAIPLFKRKGTLRGLTEALDQAGIRLTNFVQLWQLRSEYLFQEAFVYSGSNIFELTYLAILPVDDNFEFYYRGTGDWIQVTSEYVILENIDGKTYMTWIGDQAYSSPITLGEGDEVRILYRMQTIPPARQTLEDYFRTLPLMDQRDERDQDCPLKNWNTRLIEEADPLFASLIPIRNPYYDPLVFGKVRTEFPYSENIYNMEEYNGSKRDSTDPCDIDCDFIDPCSGGISSNYSVDLEIENIGNNRVLEAYEILKEFSPFHAVLFSVNLLGAINEFVPPPMEQINAYMTYRGLEMTLVNPVQTIFNRTMAPASQLRRNMLASFSVVATSTDVGSNVSIVLFSPDVRLENIGLDTVNSTLTYLEVLGTGPNAGTYNVKNPDGNIAAVTGTLPPEAPLLNGASFAFRLSNEAVRKLAVTVVQTHEFTLTDANETFANFEEIAKIVISGYGTYVASVLPNNSLLLTDTGSLPTGGATGLTYLLLNSADENIGGGTAGVISVKHRGIVDFGGPILFRGTVLTSDDIRNYVEVGNYVKLGAVSTQYPVIGFITGDTSSVVIDNYNLGAAGGIVGIVYERLIDNQIGFFHYKGMQLVTAVDYEATLGIVGGTIGDFSGDFGDDDYDLFGVGSGILDDDSFKEHFLILIGTDYYVISEISGTTITLDGPPLSWSTTGTPVPFTIVQFMKEPFTVPERHTPEEAGHVFSAPYDWAGIDRRGKEIFEITAETVPMPMYAMAETLNATKKGQPFDMVEQQESISFKIEHVEKK